MTMVCNILLIACGFFLPKIFGTVMSAGALLLLAFTTAFPFYFPPNKRIYKVLIGITVGFGGIVGLLSGLIG